MPYGYVRPEGKNQRLTVDEEKAAVVAEIFERVAGGANVSDVALELSRRGVPTPRGGRTWSLNTLAGIVKNPAYLGVSVVGDGDDAVVVHDAHPALVTRDLWDRANAARNAAHRPRRRKAVSSWLEGYVRHECGAPMYLTNRDDGMGAFRCPSGGSAIPAQLKERCPFRKKEKSQRLLEDAVWAIVVDDLAGHVLAGRGGRVRAGGRGRRPGDDAPRRRALDQREKRANEKRERAESLYLGGKRDAEWFDQIDGEVTAELEAIASERAALTAFGPDADDLLDAVRTLRTSATNSPTACPSTGRSSSRPSASPSWGSPASKWRTTRTWPRCSGPHVYYRTPPPPVPAPGFSSQLGSIGRTGSSESDCFQGRDRSIDEYRSRETDEV